MVGHLMYLSGHSPHFTPLPHTLHSDTFIHVPASPANVLSFHAVSPGLNGPTHLTLREVCSSSKAPPPSHSVVFTPPFHSLFFALYYIYLLPE